MVRVVASVVAMVVVTLISGSAQGPDIRANDDGTNPPEPVEVLSVSSDTVNCFFNGTPRLVRWNNSYFDDGTSTDVDASPVPFGSPGSQLLMGWGIIQTGTVLDGEIEGNDKLFVDCNRGFRSVTFTGFVGGDVAIVTLTNCRTGCGNAVYQQSWNGLPDPTLQFVPAHVGLYTRMVIQPLSGAFVVQGVGLP